MVLVPAGLLVRAVSRQNGARPGCCAQRSLGTSVQLDVPGPTPFARTVPSRSFVSHKHPRLRASPSTTRRRLLNHLRADLRPADQTTPSVTNAGLSEDAHYISRGSAPSDRLVFGSAPLRALSRTRSKGACPLCFPPPRPFRGAGEVVLARREMVLLTNRRE